MRDCIPITADFEWGFLLDSLRKGGFHQSSIPWRNQQDCRTLHSRIAELVGLSA
jgi:hypothetical protein